jgi:hypothetical protein
MSATTIMLIAFGALIMTHWANAQPTLNVKTLIEIVFAILFIAFLESNANTEPIAKGLAWLFLAAVLLSNNSILTKLAKVTGTGTAAPKAA